MANRQRDEHNVIQKYYVICQLFWELHSRALHLLQVMNLYVIFIYLEFHLLMSSSCIPSFSTALPYSKLIV